MDWNIVILAAGFALAGLFIGLGLNEIAEALKVKK